MSLDSFVPEDQPAKTEAHRPGAKFSIPRSTRTRLMRRRPTPRISKLWKGSAGNLRNVAGDAKGRARVASRRLADALSKLADSNQATRDKTQAIFVSPLKIMLDQLKNSLQAQPVNLKTLPADLVNSWKTKDGLIRVESTARGDPNDNDTLRKFAAAVLIAEPNAIGGPVSILKSGENVVKPHHAGITALIVIGLLLWLAAATNHRRVLTLVRC